MLSSECSVAADSVIARHGNYSTSEMIMSREKIEWLWTEMQKYPTLFSDLTKGDKDNFASLVLDRNSIWFEVLNGETLVGVIYFTEMHQRIDCAAHLIFFDRKLPEKIGICREVAKWMFDNFPINRITAVVPRIYWATIKLAKSIGFTPEGRKRKSQLIGNRWVDEDILGLLRSEVANGW